MNKDFIKWMCGYAEGFGWRKHPVHEDIIQLAFPGSVFMIMEAEEFPKDHPTWNLLLHPLLLQRAIEGVNRRSNEGKRYFISSTLSNVCVNRINYDSHTRFYFDDYDSIDKAKEAALMWVMEHADD